MQPDLSMDWSLEVWFGLSELPEYYWEEEEEEDHVYTYSKKRKPLVIRRSKTC